VLRYIQCWLETTSIRPGSEEDDDDDDRLTQTITNSLEDDSDNIFGPPDFDDLSSTNVSHSKSFPRIRFANSSDDDEDSEDDEDDSADSFAIGRDAFAMRHKSKSPRKRNVDLHQQRTLYIQMEVSKGIRVLEEHKR
jgi:hypothetical protein